MSGPILSVVVPVYNEPNLIETVLRRVLGSPVEKEVIRRILEFGRIAKLSAAENGFAILGPAPCLVSKEKGAYRWNLNLKGDSASVMTGALAQMLAGFKKGGVSVSVDVDPR